jgi:hypothetical protein
MAFFGQSSLPAGLVNRTVQGAAEAGRSQVVTAESFVDFDGMRKALDEAALEHKVSGMDEEPDPDKGVGRLDLLLAAIFADIKDKRTGQTIRSFDLLDSHDDKQFLVSLMDRRYKQGDRRLVPSTVQRCRDIGSKVGIEWHNLHHLVGAHG